MAETIVSPQPMPLTPVPHAGSTAAIEGRLATARQLFQDAADLKQAIVDDANANPAFTLAQKRKIARAEKLMLLFVKKMIAQAPELT